MQGTACFGFTCGLDCLLPCPSIKDLTRQLKACELFSATHATTTSINTAHLTRLVQDIHGSSVTQVMCKGNWKLLQVHAQSSAALHITS
jgi:uncharacterized lipoprotein YmbA